ncbi:nuclear transport factor 2 family protein [Nocardia sp. NPDC057353]|uniref:nuclear transport factor 2 family protein n=1 Tax=Nocardia sp. NPDC057353 TaxID=3346104 RepID=UPI00363FE9CC
MTHAIEEYYATVDSGRLAEATALLAEQVEFAMVLPTGTTLDSGRGAMLGYLRGRPDVDRKHHVLRVAVDGDLQFAYGDVTERGGTVTTGHFAAAMHLGPDGLIDRYQVSFSAAFALLPNGGDPR